jgi:hypothetical protein
MTLEEVQQASYELEVQKLAMEKERQDKDRQLEAQKFAFAQQIEKEKLTVEVEKARWSRIAGWFTPASILVSLAIGIGTILYSQKAQRDVAKAEFVLKATEIVLQSDDPEVNWNKACRIRALFSEDHVLPGDWAQSLDWRTYAVENDDFKREVAKEIIENPKRASKIIATYGSLFQSDQTVVNFLNRLSPDSVPFKAEQPTDCVGKPIPSH